MDFSSARLQTLFRSTKKLLSAPFWVQVSGSIFIMLLCFGFTAQALLNRHERLKKLSSEVSALCNKAEALEKQKELHKKMMEQIANAQPHYLKQKVETLPLLQGERLRVAALSKQFPGNTSLRERFQFLESDQNKISFESMRVGSDLEHHLEHRVQMDLGDLKNFLEAVEGGRYDATQKKPLLLVKKFDLIKCYEKGDEKVYSIAMELVEKI